MRVTYLSVATLGLCVPMVASGCFLFHDTSSSVAAIDAAVDGGVEASGDSPAPDASVLPDLSDGPPYISPPGVCIPLEEYRQDRFPGDSQAIRDQQHVESALLMTCYPGEGCAEITFAVGVDGHIESVDARGEELAVQDCAERAVLGLCVPTLAGQPGQALVCGV